MVAGLPGVSIDERSAFELGSPYRAGDRAVGRRAQALVDRLRAVAPSLLAWRAALIVAVVVGIALRFIPAGSLWFDEVQSVAIARLPWHGLLAALRQDGSPPLYYLLLHLWLGVFGTGTWTVRALSGLLSVATVPVVWLLARRVLPEEGRWPALLLVATSPFAIRYASEARMYALVIFLVTVGALLVCRALEDPRWPRLMAVSGVASALALSHYWALFLLVAAALGLWWRAWRGSTACLRVTVAIAGGAIPFLPWLPSMLFQIAHTGTPWAHSSGFAVLMAIPVWAGAESTGWLLLAAIPLIFLLLGLAVAGALGWRPSRQLLALVAATLALAGVASVLLDSAVVPRYTSVGLVPYLLAAAGGLASMHSGARRVALGIAIALGLVAGCMDASAPRTLAPEVASVIRKDARPADTVVYCPDQLGPDVARLLPGWAHQEVYPTAAYPERVDWVNYTSRNVAASPGNFARRVTAATGGRTIWLLEATNFISYGNRCQMLASDLASLRPDFLTLPVGADPVDTRQQETLVEFLP